MISVRLRYKDKIRYLLQNNGFPYDLISLENFSQIILNIEISSTHVSNLNQNFCI